MIGEYCEIVKLDSEEGEEITIIIPTTKEQLDLATKTAELHIKRAGMPCKVIMVINNIGWVNALNRAVRKLESKYFVYSCADYIPGREYLKRAFDVMQMNKHVKLVGFNDGKWHGRIATVGLIETEYMKTLYGGDLMFSGYTNHFADTELTRIAYDQDKYGYNSEAVLFEVDYEKEKRNVNEKDHKLFLEREKQNFKQCKFIRGKK